MPIPIFNQPISGNLIDLAGGGNYKLFLTPQQQALQNSEIRLTCRTLGGAINILLPKISELGNSLNLKVYIDDASDLAGTNNITVYTDPTNTIANGGTLVIKTNGEKAELYVASRTEYGVIGSGGGSLATDLWSFNANGFITYEAVQFATPFKPAPFQPQVAEELQYQYKGSKILTAKNLSVKAISSVVGEDTFLTVMKNGAPTTLTVSIPNGVVVGTIFNSMPLASFTFTTNDKISLRGSTQNFGNGDFFSAYCTMEVQG